jgi:hypothetical protein
MGPLLIGFAASLGITMISILIVLKWWEGRTEQKAYAQRRAHQMELQRQAASDGAWRANRHSYMR